MSTSERVYALLVEANPVPDPDHLVAERVDLENGLHVVRSRRQPMQTRQPVRTIPPQPPQRRFLIPALLAAVVAIVAVAASALLFAGDGGETTPVVTQHPATTLSTPATSAPPEPVPDPEAAAQARAETAVTKAEAVFAALNDGDLEGIEALTSPNQPIAPPDLALWEYHVVFVARYPQEVQSCEATSANEDFVRVDCIIVNHDPVFVADGVSELVFPWWVYDDGTMVWRPYEGAEIGDAVRAYRDYLLAQAPDAYAEACNPGAYEFGTVISNGGMSLTGECAELALSLAEDIAAWVEDGRPDL